MVIHIEKYLLCLVLTACDYNAKPVKQPSKVVSPAVTAVQKKSYFNYEVALNEIESKYRLVQDITLLTQLNSIACRSDADLSEMVSVTAVSMYSVNNIKFFKFVYLENLHCVERAFISGMSEELSVLDQKERLARLSELRLKLAKSSSYLSSSESKNAKALIDKIKPDAFD